MLARQLAPARTGRPNRLSHVSNSESYVDGGSLAYRSNGAAVLGRGTLTTSLLTCCSLSLWSINKHALPVGLKADGNIPGPTRSVFYFYLSVSVFVGSRFRIYGSRNEVSPSVSEESCFYMELTRIYFVFHLVFNLHKICLKIDMFKNIPITEYAC